MPYPERLAFCSNLNKVGTGTYFGTKTGWESEGLYFVYDESQKTFKWVEYSSGFDKGIDPRYKYEAYSNYMCVNEEKQIVAIALRYFNKVLFFDFDGNLIKEVQCGKTERAPEWNKANNMLTDESYGLAAICFIDVQMTDRFIYCLCLEPGKEHETLDPSRIYVFDYEQNLAAAFQFDRTVSRIAVNNNDKFLLGVSDDGTGLTDVIKYGLPEMK